MRIATKRIQILYLAPHEVEEFKAMLNEACNGQKVNYSERQVGQNSFIGIVIDEANSVQEPVAREEWQRTRGIRPRGNTAQPNVIC